ncbi:fatty acid desaturase family protein [Eleftheria terrae]|uniref:fatty acid desaturase family protein n=1 Tax=Eleftheria terrae TaxID=1597781 RepID=UPI00263B9FFD|nr:acyl-CoA desaturase [Eleftheria terrae]WKB52819.1 acyl-CoA desaturase [Eleftheria terrae]
MSHAVSARVVFAPRAPFFETLKARVRAHFASQGKGETGDWRLHAKTLFAFALFALSYVSLVWVVEHWWSAALAAFGVVQGFVLIAFNVMHDGCHGSYSRKPWINWIMGATMDLMGSSSMLWRQKHNQLHHTYTNIDGKDDDIAIGALLRLSPAQAWRPWHRLQHWYAPLLYSLLTLYLLLFSDWQKLFTGRIGHTPLQQRAWWEAPYFVGMKLFYIGYTLVLPMFFHAWWQVLLVFLAIHCVFGLTLSLVFQVAHTVEGASFPVPAAETGRLEDDWATHQVKTTANFAPGNRLAAFYMGGLNFQVEHHLLHHVSHVHYPAISKIVRQTCEEFGVPYKSFPSVRAAVAAHFRFLRGLGRAPVAA